MRRALSLTLAALWFVGCGGADGLVRVELDEFSVAAAPSSIRAGSVAFQVSNAGSVSHTFAVLETGLDAGSLPVKDSEVVVDAEGIGSLVITPDVIVPGARYELSARLAAGRYVLICTVPGHYQSGMHAPFEVTSRS